MRSNLGAIENRLGHTVSNLSNVVENTRRPSPVSRTRTSRLKQRPWPGLRILQQQGQRCWHRPTRHHKRYSAYWANSTS